MLIDAANVSNIFIYKYSFTNSNICQVQSENNTFVNLDETQRKRFEAIQKLVNIKGEGVLIDILSKIS